MEKGRGEAMGTGGHNRARRSSGACLPVSAPHHTPQAPAAPHPLTQNMSCCPSASAQGPSTAFRAALVPTATKPGVSMVPCGVWMRPTRAPDLLL